jgi:hypothetical protein
VGRSTALALAAACPARRPALVPRREQLCIKPR